MTSHDRKMPTKHDRDKADDDDDNKDRPAAAADEKEDTDLC